MSLKFSSSVNTHVTAAETNTALRCRDVVIKGEFYEAVLHNFLLIVCFTFAFVF